MIMALCLDSKNEESKLSGIQGLRGMTLCLDSKNEESKLSTMNI